MDRIKARVFWGLLFSIIFIYVFELSFALAHRPLYGGGEEMYEPRFQGMAEEIPTYISQKLMSLSFPCYLITETLLPSDPYFDVSIYTPLLGGLLWFAYGYLFGWWKERRVLKREQKLAQRNL